MNIHHKHIMHTSRSQFHSFSFEQTTICERKYEKIHEFSTKTTECGKWNGRGKHYRQFCLSLSNSLIRTKQRQECTEGIESARFYVRFKLKTTLFAFNKVKTTSRRVAKHIQFYTGKFLTYLETRHLVNNVLTNKTRQTHADLASR